MELGFNILLFLCIFIMFVAIFSYVIYGGVKTPLSLDRQRKAQRYIQKFGYVFAIIDLVIILLIITYFCTNAK